MVLAPSRLDDFKLPESERRQTMSATEGYIEMSASDVLRDMEMSWKQLRRESVITQVRQSNYLLVILDSKTSLTNVSAYSGVVRFVSAIGHNKSLVRRFHPSLFQTNVQRMQPLSV